MEQYHKKGEEHISMTKKVSKIQQTGYLHGHSTSLLEAYSSW